MSQETTSTVVSLREYVDKRLEILDKHIAKTERDNEIAIEKADKVLSYRLQGMNEWRASLQDMTSQYITRNEYSSKIEAHEAQLASLARTVYTLAGALAALQVVLQFLS